MLIIVSASGGKTGLRSIRPWCWFLAVIAIQESPAGHQIAYLGITFSASLMFIHYTEYSQLAKDEAMVAQHIQLALSQIQAFRARNQADRACGDSGVSQSH